MNGCMNGSGLARTEIKPEQQAVLLGPLKPGVLAGKVTDCGADISEDQSEMPPHKIARLDDGYEGSVDVAETPAEPADDSAMCTEAESNSESPVNSGDISESPVKSGDISESPVKSGGISESPVKSGDISESPVKSGDISESPVKSGDISESPVKSGDISEPPVKSGDISESPVKSGDISESPVKSGDISESPVKSGDISESPVKSGDISESPVKSGDISEPPVKSGDISESPVKSGDISESPVKSGDISESLAEAQPGVEPASNVAESEKSQDAGNAADTVPAADVEAARSPRATADHSHAEDDDGDADTPLPVICMENFRVPESIEQTDTIFHGSGVNSSSQLTKALLGIGVPKLSRDQQNAVNKAKKFAMEQSIRMVLMKQTITHQQQQQTHGLQRHQALVLMCRIYVGSISFELREDSVKQAFLPFGPIKSLDMSWDPIAVKHKGFAFIEYETPEAAQLAEDQMNNVVLGGRNIKVGRPSNMPQAQIIIKQVREESKSYSRIYVAGVHPSLSEHDIRCVFEAFGSINYCNLAIGGMGGTHKGYCYIDYTTMQAANDAVASMNLFDLGGQFLRVGRCCSPPQALEILNGALPPTTGPVVAMPTASSLAAANTSARLQALEEEERRRCVLQQGFVSAAAPAPQPPPPAAPSMSAMPVAVLPPPGVVQVTQLGGVASPVVLQPPPVQASMTSAGAGGLAASSAMAAAVIQMATTAAPLIHQQQQQLMRLQHDNPKEFQRLMQQLQQPMQQLQQPMQLVQQQMKQMHQPPAVLVPPPQPPQPPPAVAVSVATSAGGVSGVSDRSLSHQELRNRLAASAASEDGNAEPQTLQQQEEISVRGAAGRHIVMQRLMRPEKEQRVVVLRNMVTPEEVDETLQEEITDECNRFGQTSRVVIYQETQGDAQDADVIVKIFVEFSKPDEAGRAVASLNGRYFGGRLVKAELYDMLLYEQNDLSG